MFDLSLIFKEAGELINIPRYQQAQESEWKSSGASISI